MKDFKFDSESVYSTSNSTLPGFAFIIAVNDYSGDGISRLETPVSDAEALGQVLKSQGFHVSLITNAGLQATWEFIRNIRLKVRNQECRVLVYFAGHGVKEDTESGIKGYLLPADAERSSDTWLSMQDLLNELEELPCQHFFLILDCCFAGTIRWVSRHRGLALRDKATPISRQHYVHFTKHPSWQVLASSSHKQSAWDTFGYRKSDVKHSPFAKYLLEGLNGAADFTKNGIVTAAKLHLYLQEKLAVVTGAGNTSQNSGLFPLDKHENGEFLFFLNGFNELNLPVKSYENPYKGLESYNPIDAPLFFGRSEATEKLYKEILLHPYVLVLGDSGVGKSSLVKAGIIPKLEMLGNEVKIIRPGKTPNIALQQAGSFDVLVVDQFEELVTQAEKTESEKFCLSLSIAINSGKKVIATLRSDFERDIQKISPELAQQATKTGVADFSVDDFREIIICPASRCGRFFFPESLVGEIVEEVRYYSRALPLLSFTLHELFELAKDDPYREITFDDYNKLEGVSGSLRKKADELYNSLEPLQKRTMRNMMLRMVSNTGGEIVGRRVLRNDLIFNNDDENNRVEVVEKALIEARLLVKGKDNEKRGYLEPAHDALVRSWGTLREWIEDDKEIIPLQNKLTDAVAYYGLENKTDRLWHNDDRLPLLHSQLKMNSGWLNKWEEVFVSNSIKLKNRNRLLQNGGVAAAFVLISLAAAFAFYQKNEADAQREFVIVQRDSANFERNRARDSSLVAQLARQEAQDSAKVAREQRNIATERLAQYLSAQKEKEKQEYLKEMSDFQKYIDASKSFINASDFELAKIKIGRALTIINKYETDPFYKIEKTKLDSLIKLIKK